MTETFLVYALAIALAWPLGRYMAAVMRGAPMRGDALFGWIERPLYALLGTRPQQGMSWRGYSMAFLLSNLVVGLLTWVVFMTQAWLPFNPDAIPNMRWDTALHTMACVVDAHGRVCFGRPGPHASPGLGPAAVKLPAPSSCRPA